MIEGVRWETLKIFFSNLRWQDILDIFITAILIYFLFWFLKRTKSLRAFISVLILFFFYVFSYWLNLAVTYRILQSLAGVLIIILVVIFQGEIRRIFYLIGSWGRKVDYTSEFVERLRDVVFKMAKNKTGALIIMPGKEDPSPYFVNKGIVVEARFSEPLILSIFDDSSPGHDGAVVLDGEIIKEFGVHLPLSQDKRQLKNFGTRHSAGLGIAEKTDVLSIIVSEEKGTVSIAHNKKLKEVKEEEFISILNDFIKSLKKEELAGNKSPLIENLRKNFALIFTSLFLAFGVWAIVSYPNLGIVQKHFIVPIEFTNIQKGLSVSDVKPIEVVATFSGRSQDFELLEPGNLKINIDLSKFDKIGKHKVNLRKEYLKYPTSLILVDLNPDFVQFNIVNVFGEKTK